MKKILLGLALLSSISSFASCKVEDKTEKLINKLDKYDVTIKQRFVRDDIQETKELIASGQFCDDSFAALSLCTSLVTEHAYFGGLKASKASNQYSLEKALYEFAEMFNAPTSNSFGCNLIELDFPALSGSN
jgi:hypothetical protein